MIMCPIFFAANYVALRNQKLGRFNYTPPLRILHITDTKWLSRSACLYSFHHRTVGQ